MRLYNKYIIYYHKINFDKITTKISYDSNCLKTLRNKINYTKIRINVSSLWCFIIISFKIEKKSFVFFCFFLCKYTQLDNWISICNSRITVINHTLQLLKFYIKTSNYINSNSNNLTSFPINKNPQNIKLWNYTTKVWVSTESNYD